MTDLQVLGLPMTEPALLASDRALPDRVFRRKPLELRMF